MKFKTEITEIYKDLDFFFLRQQDQWNQAQLMNNIEIVAFPAFQDEDLDEIIIM
jgi:hypothetical protein